MFLFISLFMLLISSCDQTTLSGEILAESDELEVGTEFTLQLQVPPELDGIYRVHWEVEPLGAASIQYLECQDRECEPDSGYKQDRTAAIVPTAAGEMTVYVSGFYRQTNPQGITKRTFTVIE